MHSFCQTRLLTFLDPFCSIVVGEERGERERGTHPRGRKGGARCCLFCSVYSLCLRVNPDAQPQHSRVVGGTDNTSVGLSLPYSSSTSSLRDLFRFSPFFSSKQLPATQYSDSSPVFFIFVFLLVVRSGTSVVTSSHLYSLLASLLLIFSPCASFPSLLVWLASFFLFFLRVFLCFGVRSMKWTMSLCRPRRLFYSYLVFGRLFAANIAFRFLAV